MPRFMDARLKVAKSPKLDYHDDAQALVTSMFYDSSNWYTISEETAFGSSSFQNIDARISSLINPTTGVNVGDDWKVLTFADIDKRVRLGALFYFETNYWLVTNVEAIATLYSGVTVRRCNNHLRWIDENGGKHSIPCVLDYSIQENRDYATAGSAIVNPSGILQVQAQLNSTSNQIESNQRFLFGNSGNWTAYKVFGGGINNFMNAETSDNNSAGLLKLTLGVNFVNEDIDDLTNGIADIGESLYALTISESSISGNPGDTIQLYATITRNGISATRTITWATNDPDVATVSSSGLVTFVDEGTCTITATMQDRVDVYDTCPVTVTLAPVSEYQIVITPNQNYVLEGDTQTFTVNLYLNGSVQVDTFSFVLSPNTVPSVNYEYTVIGGNSFSIRNKTMFLGDTLDIQCTSGIHVKTISVLLNGAW